MKKALFFACLVVASALIISVVVPVVYSFMGHYYDLDQRRLMLEMAKTRNDALVSALKADAQRNSQSSTMPVVPQANTTPQGKPVLVDPAGFKTENNYLAQVIAKDIVEQAYIGTHPTETLPTFEVTAIVSSDRAPYSAQVLASSSSTSLLQVDMHIAFAWDAVEYSKVAAAALGDAKATGSDARADQILSDLLEPTGAKLAQEDRRLSAELQHNPLDAQAHEEAALLLISMALRENAGRYTDCRLFLCRATAHLALADALGNGQPSWNNRIADAAIRVIAGRETEATPLLKGLEQMSDCPPAAKTWIAALKIWNRQDVTAAAVTADSPRLLKIAWFQTLARNLPPLSVVSSLETLGKPEMIVDWTRAIISAAPLPVEIGNRFCQPSLDIEYRELGEILATEEAPAVDMGHLDQVFSEPETEAVTSNASGHPIIRVVGTGSFKAAVRRHVFNSLEQNYIWLAKMLGDPEGAKTFLGQTIALYRGVPFFEWVRQSVRSDDEPYLQIDAVLRQEKKTWKVSDLTPMEAIPDFVGEPASSDLANSFFLDGPPVGTTFGYKLSGLISCLKTGSDWHRDPYNVDPKADLKLLFLKQLAEMTPHSLDLAWAVASWGNGITTDEVMGRMSPFFSYNIHAIEDVDDYDGRFYNLTDAQKESLLKNEAALNTDVYFQYGDYLWKNGRQDEAVEAYRKGVAEGRDQVLMSGSVDNLVNYDYDHGKKDEALQIAQKAADVFSRHGLTVYLLLLEKMGDFAGAETQAQAISDRYGGDEELSGLYSRHPEKYPGKYDAKINQAFPNGITAVTLASFKDPPTSGVQITSSSDLLSAAGLRQGDVIVAVDGSKVENEAQYELIRGRTQNPMMDLIVWQVSEYIEVKASPPNRHFMVELQTYSPASP